MDIFHDIAQFYHLYWLRSLGSILFTYLSAVFRLLLFAAIHENYLVLTNFMCLIILLFGLRITIAILNEITYRLTAQV